MPRDNYTRYPRAILWLVRGGEALIGGDDDDNRPRFTVTLGSFYLSKLPVTNRQYEAYDPDFRRSSRSPGDDDPATGVDFRGAAGYCRWYSEVSRKPMRLPTEVEWEYACRCGATSRYFFGEAAERGDDYVWDAGNSGNTVPSLGRKKPNPWGLHSMLGGVWEWTASLYRPYPVEPGDGRDDDAEDGLRVLRGGSFLVEREDLGCAVRRGEDPAARFDDVGFRIARSL